MVHARDKSYKKFTKLTKLHVDEDIHKETRNAVQNLIRKKKKTYFKEKLEVTQFILKNLVNLKTNRFAK